MSSALEQRFPDSVFLRNTKGERARFKKANLGNRNWAGWVHLQSYGKAPAVLVSDLKVGDYILYNYGYKSQVKSITPKGKASVVVETESAKDGKLYDRTYRLKSLIPILSDRQIQIHQRLKSKGYAAETSEEKIDIDDFNKVADAIQAVGQPATVLFETKFGTPTIVVVLGDDIYDDENVEIVLDILDDLKIPFDSSSVVGDTTTLERKKYDRLRKIKGGHKDFLAETKTKDTQERQINYSLAEDLIDKASDYYNKCLNRDGYHPEDEDAEEIEDLCREAVALARSIGLDVEYRPYMDNRLGISDLEDQLYEEGMEAGLEDSFGAEAGTYRINWNDGKKGVTFDFEGGDDMQFDDEWTDRFWDASNPQVKRDAESFNAVVIAPEPPKGIVEKALMNHYLFQESTLRQALMEIENRVELGLMSVEEAEKRLNRLIQQKMRSENYASENTSKKLLSGVFMLVAVASLWRAVTVTEDTYLFPKENKYMTILGSASIGLGILAWKGDSILAALED